MLFRSLRPPHHKVSQYRWARQFTVLAFESSADDTCAAIVTSDRKILSNVVIKQNHEHEPYGGIQPLAAVHEHQRNMPIAVRRALDEAELEVSQVDGIAFTRGPGMNSCLGVAANAAKTLAAALNKPLVGVHHMQAHALTVLLTSPLPEIPQYPFMTLLVSGGHTLLLLATSPTSFRTLATTDEAIGRVFDKVSRALALPWSTHGPGAALEQFCLSSPPSHEGDRAHVPPFPLAMLGKLQFSYTGLHSAVLRHIEHNDGPLSDKHRVALARAFQTAAVGQLEEKLVLALRQCVAEGVHVRHVVVSGGVASNLFLRQRLKSSLETMFPENNISLVFPPPALCTDNAVMIAWASMHRFLSKDYDDYSVAQRSKWDIEELKI